MGKETFTIQASHKVHSVEFCERLAKELGVEYGGICDNRHFFEKVFEGRKERIDDRTWKIIPKTYGMIECRDEDISNGSIRYYVQHGLTFPATPQEVAFFETDEGVDLLNADWSQATP